MTDEQLLINLAEGEASALDALFNRHSGKIMQYCRKKGFSPEAAEDLVQIIFLQVFRKKHLYKSEFKGLAWIYVISKSEMRDFYLKEKRHLEKNQASLAPELSQSRTLAPNSVEETLIQQSEVQHLLSQVKGKEKQVLEMKWLEEMDYPEIAQALNEKESNLRQISSRTLRQLKNLLGKDE